MDTLPAGFTAVQVYSLLSSRRTSVIFREPEGRTVNLGAVRGQGWLDGENKTLHQSGEQLTVTDMCPAHVST